MKKRNKILTILAVIVFGLVADGTKSYFVAKRQVAGQTNLRCSGLLFAGVWLVSFKFDGAHPDSTATFKVAPILPWIVKERYCK